MNDRLIEGFAAAQGTMARQEELIEVLAAAVPEDPWMQDGDMDVACYSCGVMNEGTHDPDCKWVIARRDYEVWRAR